MKAHGKAASAAPVEVRIGDPAWRTLGSPLPEIRCAARLALAHAGRARRGAGLTILLTSDERVQKLNWRYRGKDGPTNVLSFPSRHPGHLGDIAIAFGVTTREAEAAGASPLHHLLHLAVHGVLHLLGYDHESLADAELMESLEAEILAEMDIPNPYLRRGSAA